MFFAKHCPNKKFYDEHVTLPSIKVKRDSINNNLIIMKLGDQILCISN